MTKISFHEQLQKRINRKLSRLSQTEKTIAEYILRSHQEIALISIQELSRRLNVGRATIVRLAKRLGYDGFGGLKTAMKAGLQNQLGPLERYDTELSRRHANGHAELAAIAQQEVDNITATLQLFDRTMFQRAVRLVRGAEDIFTVGMGISNFLAQIMAYFLRRIGLRSFPLNEGGLKLTEQLITADRHDLLIAFSLPPYSRETIEAVRYAHSQGAKVLLITNAASSPVIQYADAYLFAKTESRLFSNSLSAIIMLINTLSSDVATKDRRRAKRALRKMLDLRSGKADLIKFTPRT